MRYPAKKVHWGFRIPAFQFTVGRTHPAHGFDLTCRAFGFPGRFFLSQIKKILLPTLLEAAVAKIIAVSG